MRNYNYCIKTALAVFAVALSACSSDNDIVDNNSNNQEKPVSEKKMSFSANMDAENTTRTDFNSNSTIWAKGDAIQVLNTATITDPNEPSLNNGVFSIVESTDENYIYTKEEKFTGPSIGANGNDNDQFYAFYPSTVTTSTTSGVKMSAEVPTIQTAMEGTYDQSLHFMTAYSTNSTFAFKNVCALLKITIKNTSTFRQISRIKVVANPTLSPVNAQQFGYTSIAGQFDATINTSGIASVTPTEDKKTYVELRAKGDKGTATTVIGVGTYYLVVLPATISNGFTLLLETSTGTIYQRVNSKVTSFERNKIYDLGEYDFTTGAASGMTTLSANDAVDLDLPSGTIWCKKNVKKDGSLAALYEDGDYYSFGKTSVYSITAYTLSWPSLTNNTLKSGDDVAYSSKTSYRYCMPVYAQLYELYYSFSDEYKNSFKNGNTNKGAEFTAATGQILWLPYSGHYWAGVLQDQGSMTAYWSRSCTGSVRDGYCLELTEGNVTVNGQNKAVPVLNSHTGVFDGASEWSDDGYTGRTIRPVAVNAKIAPIY